MTECEHDAGQSEIPADIAKLYLAANLPGHWYRDFSASRRETRDHLRRMLQERASQAAKPAKPSPPPQNGEVCVEPTSATEISKPLRQPEAWSPETEGTPRSAPGSEAIPSSTGEPPVLARASHRWFLLTNIFSPERASREPRTSPGEIGRVPTIVFFSVAGGVGKTSLVATVGRALAAYGERVLLVDATRFGLLPLYFGSGESKPGIVRTFAPPNNSPDAPVHAVNLDPSELRAESGERDPFLEALLHDAHGSNRILVDVRTASLDTVRRLLPLAPIVLVPIVPDMNSVASLKGVEAVFSTEEIAIQRRIQPFYLLNQFDPLLPLHVDVREILRQQLGSRLLPFVVRSSSAVSEALADGMTVVDYAPDSPAAQDFLRLAGWLRSVSGAASGFRGARWSEK
jgi:cellulose synthase operon protein YhjQ